MCSVDSNYLADDLGKVDHLLFRDYSYKTERRELEKIVIEGVDSKKSQFYTQLAPVMRRCGYFSRQPGPMTVAREALLLLRSVTDPLIGQRSIVLPGGISMLFEIVREGVSLDGITDDVPRNLERTNLYGQPVRCSPICPTLRLPRPPGLARLPSLDPSRPQSIVEMALAPALSEEELFEPPPRKPIADFDGLYAAMPYERSPLKSEAVDAWRARERVRNNLADLIVGTIVVVDGEPFVQWPYDIGLLRVPDYLTLLYLTWRHTVAETSQERCQASNYSLLRDDRRPELTEHRTRGGSAAPPGGATAPLPSSMAACAAATGS